MKKTWMIPAVAALTLLVSASPSSGTIVFSAFAGLSVFPAPCAPGGTLWSFSGTHSGTVHSMDAGDYGRNFDLDGTTDDCGWGFPRASCSGAGSAGIVDNVQCTTYFEELENRCENRSYKATASVYVTDGGGESDYDETSCQSCG